MCSSARIDEKRPWGSGLIVVGPEAAAVRIALMEAIPARLRLLSSSGTAETLLFVTGDLAPAKAIGVKGQVRLKLIEVPLSDASIGPDELKSGRLPVPGGDEILAGAKIEPGETLNVGVNSLKVVGALRPGVALFANAFLIPPSAFE